MTQFACINFFTTNTHTLEKYRFSKCCHNFSKCDNRVNPISGKHNEFASKHIEQIYTQVKLKVAIYEIIILLIILFL